MANPRSRQTQGFTRDSGSGDITEITNTDKVILGDAGQTSSADVLIDLDSTSKTVLLPRISNIKFDNPPPNPLEGMLAYDNHTNEKTLVYYNGTDWVSTIANFGQISHSSLANLDANDHQQYILWEGSGCCQYIFGGVNQGGTLVLGSTAHATKGLIEIGTSRYDESSNRLGLSVGGTSVDYTLDINGDMRIRPLGTGLLRVDDGVVGVDPGGGGGSFFTRDSGDGILYPNTSTDSINIGALTAPAGTSQRSKLSIIVPDSYSDTWIVGIVRTPSATPVFEITEAGGMAVGGTPTGAEVYFNTPLRTTGAVRFTSVTGGLNIGPNVLPTDLHFRVESTTKGSLPYPPMTETQRDAISSPTNGNTVWNSTTDLPNVWIDSQWYSFDLTAVGGGGGGNPADDFNRTSENLATADGGSGSSSGHDWTAVRSGANEWKVVSDTKAGTVNPNTRAICYLSGQANDGTIEVTMATIGPGTSDNSFCGLAFRYDPTDNDFFWFVEIREFNNQVRLGRWNEGHDQSFDASHTWATGDKIKVVFSGSGSSTDIQVSIDSGGGYVLLIDKTSGGLGQATQTWTSTANHGLMAHSATDSDIPEWDDYSFTP